MTKFTEEVLHLRNHLQSIQRQLDPESLRHNPQLLNVICANQIVRKLDQIAYLLATTPHEYRPYYEIWQYNAEAVQHWFMHAVHNELAKFAPEHVAQVHTFLFVDSMAQAIIQGTLEDRSNIGYIPADLIDSNLHALMSNTNLAYSITGLLRPSAIFARILSLFQDLALRANITTDEIWVLQDDEPSHDGRTFRKCLVFLALTCAMRSLLNSPISEINPDVKLASTRVFNFLPHL